LAVEPAAPLMTVERPLDVAPASLLLESDFQPESSAEFEPPASKPEQEAAAAAIARRRRRYLGNAGTVLLACGIVGASSWFGAQRLREWRTAPVAPAASLGTAVFKSSPDGATITIDGIVRGTTPVTLALSAGEHTFTITSGEVSRTLPLVVEAGAVFSQYVEFAAQPPPIGGRLENGSGPGGAEAKDGTLRRGAPVAAAPVAGWLTIDAPFEMEVYEAGQLVGTSRSDRIMLPVGSHDLQLTNTNLEFTGRRSVTIAPGKTASLNVALPSGQLSVNAVPWAEVSIDGRPAGTTPLGNLTVPLGSHEVVWRHPQLGERRQTVTVKAQSPTRVGVDFGK
jgi:PEGA domain-containing protein